MESALEPEALDLLEVEKDLNCNFDDKMKSSFDRSFQKPKDNGNLVGDLNKSKDDMHRDGYSYWNQVQEENLCLNILALGMDMKVQCTEQQTNS